MHQFGALKSLQKKTLTYLIGGYMQDNPIGTEETRRTRVEWVKKVLATRSGWQLPLSISFSGVSGEEHKEFLEALAPYGFTRSYMLHGYSIYKRGYL